MDFQSIVLAAAAAFTALAAFAFIAERRRAKRRDLDKVGWVPWNLVQISAIIGAAAAVAFALTA
jgi:hypothetical protein